MKSPQIALVYDRKKVASPPKAASVEIRLTYERIREKFGQGHNDKGEYFCPTCGNSIEVIEEDGGTTYRGCRTCNRNFDREKEERERNEYR